MSSFTGVSSIRNVQWKFQKNLQESILLILKTQYIIWIFRVVSLFSYQGSLLSLFASAINIISNLFDVVNTFFNFFFVSLSRQQVLSYQIHLILSTLFFIFFKKVFSGFCYHAKNQLSCVSSTNWQTEKEGFEPSRRY